VSTTEQTSPRSELQELAATGAFEQAIEYAAQVDRNQPLLPPEWPLESQLLPTVGDLLLALGAEHFEATAHVTLAQMFLERSNLELAEQHLDAARARGAQVAFGYQDLTTGYEQVNRPVDAARAGLKALAYGPHERDDLARLLANLGTGLREALAR